MWASVQKSRLRGEKIKVKIDRGALGYDKNTVYRGILIGDERGECQKEGWELKRRW